MHPSHIYQSRCGATTKRESTQQSGNHPSTSVAWLLRGSFEGDHFQNVRDITPSTTTDQEGHVTDRSSSTNDAATRVVDALHGTPETARQVEQVAASVRDRVRSEVDKRTTTAGEQVAAVGRTMREMSEHLRSDGGDLPARLSDGIADGAERLGGYLRESDAETIVGDVEDFGRRQPWVMLTAGLAVGVAAARFLKASSRRRHERRSRGTVASELGSGVDVASPGTAG
jgi:hypothetical protein